MIGPHPSATGLRRCSQQPGRKRRLAPGAYLQEGWVIANHILVSFHAAFISSVLALPPVAVSKGEVLAFIFVSHETLVSALYLYASFHVAIAVHEIGHFLTAARLNALNESIAEEVRSQLEQQGLQRWLYLTKVFILAPWGKATGIKRQGLNYYPDAPYNLAVAAAGPAASLAAARIALPLAIVLVTAGLWFSWAYVIYAGRFFLGIGIVTLLDFWIADRGKYREFQERERKARDAAETLPIATGWFAQAAEAKQHLLARRMQEVGHPGLGPVTAPWQFRNCGMGGRHTEKEYPESNISMQEAMFLIVGARDYLDAQEMTVTLQARLKEIIENAEGCRVMGIGLEGGLAPYIDPGDYPLPEVRLWVMMKQAIEECGYLPGEEVALALDPAMSELEIAYREEFGVPDSIGMYLFWRDKTKQVLDRNAVLELFDRALREFEIPILSIEDGFSEDDHEGWKQLQDSLGDRLLIIGDDLVTTNDATIEDAADRGLMNTALIKANQIGTLHETVLAMLVALSKGLSLVISHRSKSPNDDMEAHLALATNSLGLKAGGGANTERLLKYHQVASQMARMERGDTASGVVDGSAVVVGLVGAEEPTNAGIPTVGVEVSVLVSTGDVRLSFRGATPLGTSAGTGEAVHLVDGSFEGAEHVETLSTHRALLKEIEPGVFTFVKSVTQEQVRETGDSHLLDLYTRAQRYKGYGCMNAVENVRDVIAPYFRGRDLASASFLELDRALLQLERSTAERRGKLNAETGSPEDIAAVQRKQNLGMNAILATSLAVARAIAHVQGKQLWELIREEMLGIIEKLATANGVAIDGSRWEDYVAALRVVGERLTADGISVHQQLRALTGIYSDPNLAPPSSLPLMQEAGASHAAGSSKAAAAPAKSGSTSESDQEEGGSEFTLPESGELAIREVSTALHSAYVMGEDADERRRTLRQYIRVRDEIMKTVRPFEIVNDRIVRSEDRLVVAYLAGDDLLVHVVREGEVAVTSRPIRPGTIITDKLLAEMTAIEGLVIDLESQLYGYDVDAIPEVRITRIRDMVSQLRELETTANYYRAAIHLRCLVVRLCESSFRGFLGAKNLRPEVRQLGEEIAKLLNGPFADRLRLAMRVLVRNVAGLLLRPSLIDQVWNDAIDLSEIQVRGSRIANELRRSSHHALGLSTLKLATAYHEYLQTGDTRLLNELDFDSVSPADEAARQKTAPRDLVERIMHNMEKLLGSAEIITRIREWQDAYSEALVRCDFGKSLDEELEAITTGGIQARNRWVFHHHLRILGKKVNEVAPLLDNAEHKNGLLALSDFDPASTDFDAERAEQDVRSVVTGLESTLRARCQQPLFELLDEALTAFQRNAFLESLRIISKLRTDVEELIETGGFADQRYLLYQLDCLLEEMGYLSVRHIANFFDREGLLVEECFEIIAIAANNLSHDGLHSDEMIELANMLRTPGRTNVELLDILQALLDCYHRIQQRTSMTFEPLGERLELSTDDLRIVVANLQRYMHDLNSIAHLADLAEAHLRSLEDDPSATVQDRGDAPKLAPFDILHLSDRERIASYIEKRELCLRDRFGGKAAGLIRISHAGIPTRDGFILPTDLARSGIHDENPAEFEAKIEAHVKILEKDVARHEGTSGRFGNTDNPLLLAVRGGSVFSMPGILSTVVFVGINDDVAESLAEEDPWYAYDTYRRFLTSWGGAVMGVELERFNLVEEAKRSHGIRYKNDLPWQAMREIAENCKNILRQHGRSEVLDEALRDPKRQLIAAVRAVLGSWNTERAQRYREIKGMSETWNTAVIIQQMASGNRRNAEVCEGMDEAQCSLTGVIPHSMVTRLGLRRLTGDIKFSASGDDLVGGLTAADSFEPIANLRSLMPMLERKIDHAGTRIRLSRGTDVELEFTVERGVLSILQARTAATALREDVNSFDKPGEPIATAIGIRGGAFRGRVAFDVDDLAALSEVSSDDSDGVLLLLENPTPAEIPMILSADGLLAARGGSTSHAAVALHGVQDRPFSAVLGATALQVDTASHRARLVDRDGETIATIATGDVISIDGRTGAIWIGPKPLLKPPTAEAGISPHE